MLLVKFQFYKYFIDQGKVEYLVGGDNFQTTACMEECFKL